MCGSSEIFRASPDEIDVPLRVLAARLGFKGVGRIPDEFKTIFEEAMERARAVSDPVALHATFQSRDLGDGIEVCGKELTGRSVEMFLKGSSKITLILATLGKGLDEEVERLHSEGNDLLSFFLDGIGSELVEYFVRKLDAKLRDEMGEGGPRISPGYGDLPLSLNAWIIDTLGGEGIGVSYDPETFVMIPRKTISAIIGWR